MKIRRLAALVSAAVLVLGMATAVPATATECEPAPEQPAVNQIAWECEPPPECNPEGQQNGQCPETTDEPSSEPSEEASSEASEEASSEASEEASVVPEEDGQVEGLTSEPTLPPTDALSSSGTSGPDGTLPLVLIVLGVIGLAAVVLTPARARR
jgi:outer membrane biosynthesis protein TonB